MKLAIKRSLIETYCSHTGSSGADEGSGSKPGVPDVPTYGSNDEKISWKSSNEEGDDEVGLNDDKTDSDNDGDDFVHPKLSNQDQEVRHNEEESDEEIQGANVKEEEFDEEQINDEDEANELYRDVNVNLEGRDIEMTDTQ
ncbi:hypothetical protein Tco_1267733 [Tanacetum coccineum]